MHTRITRKPRLAAPQRRLRRLGAALMLLSLIAALKAQAGEPIIAPAPLPLQCQAEPALQPATLRGRVADAADPDAADPGSAARGSAATAEAAPARSRLGLAIAMCLLTGALLRGRESPASNPASALTPRGPLPIGPDCSPTRRTA
jgi:hypothetical protein